MSKVSLLAKTLKNINRTAKKILKDAVPIAEDLADDNSELLEELLEQYPHVTEQEGGELLQQILLSFIEDAERVESEVDAFSNVVCDGDDAIMEAVGCSFFQELWFGDIYDATGHKALDTFLKDLRSTSMKVNDDSILDEARSQIPEKQNAQKKSEEVEDEDDSEEEETGVLQAQE